MDEVRYERLRPTDLRKAREACPVVYIPIGTLEWHGWHNPVGLDSLKAHALAVRCAQRGGGLVFPPLYYGEVRDEALVDSAPPCVEQVSAAMGLDPKNFEPGHMRRSPAEQIDGYIKLLLHLFNEAQSLGFRVISLVAGHYPLLDHGRAAAALFHQQRWGSKNVPYYAIPWVFSGYELVRDVWPDSGDHGSWWETSLLLELEPELVDLRAAPHDPELGVGGPRPLVEANRETGRKAVELIVERAAEQVRQRLEHGVDFLPHGYRI